MAREGIDARRLEIANEMISRALSRVRSDRNFPAWVSRTLSGDRRFGSRDRRFYRELIYTAVRFLPWIETVPESDRGRAALWLSLDSSATGEARKAAFPGAPESWASIAERAAAFKATFATADAVAARLLPEWIADECPALLHPEELSVLNTRAPLWLRIRDRDVAAAANALSVDGIEIEPDARIPGAARVVPGPDVTRSRAYAGGLVEVQDIGSQWVLHTASPVAGERWLDACAGAGGKTLQLASMLGPQNPVAAHDIREAALAELKDRAARAGVTSIEIVTRVSGEFDAILVDAPCSGSGTWRRSPHLKWQTTRSDLQKAAATQLELLARFAGFVRPGGRLVYATCSVATTENLGVVRSFLAGHSDFHPETPGSAPLGTTLLPSQLDSDGFFVAVLRRGNR